MKLQPRELEFEDAPDASTALDAIVSDDAGSSIDAWLNVVSRMMRLPEPARREICSELREHLRERVRDLLLSGGPECDERLALRTAIDELGETAQLARRFEAANQPPRRRLLMHAMLTLGCAGLFAAGVYTFSHNQPGSSVMESRYPAEVASAAPPADTLENARCTMTADVTLRDAVSNIIKAGDVGLIIDWSHMQNEGIDPDQSIGMEFKGLSGARALTLIAQACGGGTAGGGVDWRMRENNLVEFGLRRELDRREIELMTYDISGTINQIAGTFAADQNEASQQVLELLTTMIEPENWVNNGGDLAQMKLVGGRLFVQAPSRMQSKVKWILEQLPGADQPPQVNAGGKGGFGGEDKVPILGDLPIIANFYKNSPVRTLMNPGDTVTVSIFELYQPNTWATSTRRIDEDGMYRVSEIGDVRAAGLSVKQFEAEVARQVEQKAMGTPTQVTVVIENGVAR